MPPIPKKTKSKKVSIKKLRDKADNVFSHFIRERDSNICFTCKKQLDPKESQCGHFMSRSHLNTRFSEENCHCQCVACNVFKHGNYPVYALELMKKFNGGWIIEKLNFESQIIKKMYASDYQAIIDKYSKLLKESI